MRWTAGGLGLMAVGYATVVGTAWSRYGHVPSASPDERDAAARSVHAGVRGGGAPPRARRGAAVMTLSAAADTDLQQSTIVRAIFSARELVLGAEPDAEAPHPKGLLAQTTSSLGWRVVRR